jgi:hypothetical protein
MVDEFAHLAQVDRHIAVTNQHIRKQEQLIERLGAKGYKIDEAENFLSILVGILSALESQRLLILDQLQSPIGSPQACAAPAAAGATPNRNGRPQHLASAPKPLQET